MGLRYAPNYPPGIEVWGWKNKGVQCWSVEYTPQGIIGAKGRPLGVIRLAAPCVYVIHGHDHPALTGKHQAIWWLYQTETGAISPRVDDEVEL